MLCTASLWRVTAADEQAGPALRFLEHIRREHDNTSGATGERPREVVSPGPAQAGANASIHPRPALPHAPKPAAAHERSHPPRRSEPAQAGQTRLFMSVGAEMGVSEKDIVEAIQGATGLPRETIGKVDLRERHLFVNVSSEQVQSIVGKLNRCEIKGRKAKVKVA